MTLTATQEQELEEVCKHTADRPRAGVVPGRVDGGTWEGPARDCLRPWHSSDDTALVVVVSEMAPTQRAAPGRSLYVCC